MLKKNSLLLFLFLSSYCHAQDTLQKRYVDIHTHISLKNYLRAVEHADSVITNPTPYKYDNWYNVQTNYNVTEKSNQANFFQADLINLAAGQYKIVCNSVTPLEVKSLYNMVERYANSAMETKIPYAKLTNMYYSTPFKEFIAENTFIDNQRTLTAPKLPTFTFKLVKNKAELLDCIATNKMAIVTTIEGGHTLYGHRAIRDHYFLDPHCDLDCKKEILENTKTLMNLDHRVLFMGLCHLFGNKLAGHAKALDIGSNSKYNEFLMRRLIIVATKTPILKGLLDIKHFDGIADGKKEIYNMSTQEKVMNNDVGMEVIKILLDSTQSKHNKPILVDIKHMDIQSRLDYYKILDSDPKYQNIPIICSHAAASGKNQKLALITGSYPYYDAYAENRNPAKYYKKNWSIWKKEFGLSDNDMPNQMAWLNPFSINLYDEEIKRIYDSKGLIGLIFEQRTLGGYMKNYNEDRAELLIDELNKRYHLSSDSATLYLETEPLIRNMLYFVEKSGRKDNSAWQTICLGSDFDGFIDPINTCITASFLPQLDRLLKSLRPCIWI